MADETVQVPARGEFLVRDGKVFEVLESEQQGYAEGEIGYLVWAKEPDGE